MMSRYPQEMQDAVANGFADYMENADADAIMADEHPSEEEHDSQQLLPDPSSDED